ncbi:hypothetical protein HUT29_17745 [Pseudomonas chlororaphis]|uniref:hypothetical protein n=1 Tax=Pseudomonas chlororaphis TaxID=587753 RepID=UPI001B30ABB8|nr:hypothetical protein [Pseudomonas chlororaphis]QTT83059.1 hypothetical protein HUT29_17745 [Pseudomonas chlororaphis]
MTSQAYLVGVGTVKEQLSRYSHSSVLDCTLKHLGLRGESIAEEISMMPWIVMFLLKVALLGPSGDKEIDGREFNRIANDIFHLQSAAADLESGSIELKIRALLLGQMLYQKQTVNGFR